ncbi:MAG: dTDP-glucose 4,6-dehydratase [Candidatus Marinimicrobia bacterium]|nr:dTDP-glucose 4,6-dehydratase [Candidatus Neomarinimicrobiota bacterium]
MYKILVTGGSGFIGSNFIYYCLNKNNKVLNFDKLTYAGNLSNLKEEESNKNYHFIQGDICNKNKLTKSIEKFKPDFIINFAAETHVDRSIENSSSFIKTNILGTSILLDCCLENIDKNINDFKLLHISTDEVYGSLDRQGSFTEESPYNPSSPYSASKASSDHLVNAWHKTYGIKTNIINCSNNYGPFQFPEKLIPLVIISAIRENSLPVYGTGKNIRDWLYVEDHCRAIYNVLLNGKIGDTYNVGGGEEKTNLEVVNNICDILDDIYPSENLKSYKELIKFVEDRPGHDFRYAIDYSKLKNELSWQPKESFNSGLRKTIDWYLKNLDWIKNITTDKYNLSRLGL